VFREGKAQISCGSLFQNAGPEYENAYGMVMVSSVRAMISRVRASIKISKVTRTRVK